MTYREVNRDTVQVRPKHGKKSCGDYKVSKQDFWILEKLTHRSSDGMEPKILVSGRGWPISRGRSGRYKWYKSWLAISFLIWEVSWDLSWGATKTLHSLEGVNCNIPSCDIWKGLRGLIWLPMSLKLTYFFRHTSVSNFKVKCAWAGVVKWWMIYRKVICHTMQVR